MAGVSKDGKGYRVQFMYNGKRRRLRLKGHNERQAESVGRHIDALVLHKVSGQTVDGAAAQWLADIGDDLYEKLRGFGLVNSRAAATGTERLCDYVERLVKRGRTNEGKRAKPRTLQKWRLTQRYMLECWGNTVSVDNITSDDAKDFRGWLEDKDGIESENAIRKHCQIAQMFFNAAIDAELIARNPFRKIPTASIVNKDRDYFVTRKEFDACVAHCPDLQWRVILYLARVAGVRCPSEMVLATWHDINWKRNTMVIHSPKTEHHIGHEKRLIPLFPELGRVLREAWENSVAGESRIVTRYTDGDQNMRTTLLKIIKRAGLTPWPKLFQNLRASRENELIDQGIRPDVAAAWIGHSVRVQRESYLQVTDEHFAEGMNL